MATTVGFIGLGIMGRPMLRNILKRGHKAVGLNRSRPPMDAMAAEGVEIGRSPRDVAERADIVILMLPDSPDVRKVVCGDDGVMFGVKPGQIVVDMSSVNPLATKEIGAELAKRGGVYLDAPVSGGEEKAITGDLAIMVGGDEQAFERARPVLECMGKPTLVGPLGAGHTAKLVNQTIVAVNIAAVAEGMCLAKKAGVDPVRVFEAIRRGLAGSQCLEDKAPRMFEGRYDPGFKIDLHLKDLKNVLAAADSLGVKMPLTGDMADVLAELAAEGRGGLDDGALALHYEKINGVSLKS